MDQNDSNHADNFSAAFPLPEDMQQLEEREKTAEPNPAADLVRRKVEAAYAKEPAVKEELADLKELGTEIKPSKHQQFIVELTSSGKPLADIQVAWHEYYAGLSDLEKHQVWQEFYNAHAEASHYTASIPSMAPGHPAAPKKVVRTAAQRKKSAKKIQSWEDLAGVASDKFKRRSSLDARQYLKSLAFGLSVGFLVLLVILFSFFNERFIAPFIQPSRNVSNTPIISANQSISSTPEIIIPKINVEIPVVYGVNTVDENAVETALESGVVHYADTADPGQNGNLVIVGHSSNNIFNKGKYKFAFVLLSRMDNGDTFYIQKDGKRYTYQVYEKKIVKPDDVSVLGTSSKPATATLITCDPPGTSINRLVVVGEQIDPNPIANAPSSGKNTLATSSKIVPGNSPSLWSRLMHAL
ncbi:class D sortase [Candidatus Saccharibacteria bacterium]|nr:class D sortase [Candidatus Saccharibacteria bacterium]